MPPQVSLRDDVWRLTLANKCRNSILTMCHYLDLHSATLQVEVSLLHYKVIHVTCQLHSWFVNFLWPGNEDIFPVVASVHPKVERSNDWKYICTHTLCFRLVEANFLCSTTNQRHYSDLGSDMSSVWNSCASSTDVILWGNQWWHCKLSAVSSGY